MNLRTKCAGMPGVTPTAEYYKKKSKPTYTMPKSEPVRYTLNQLKDMLQMSSYAVRSLLKTTTFLHLSAARVKSLSCAPHLMSSYRTSTDTQLKLLFFIRLFTENLWRAFVLSAFVRLGFCI